MDLLRFILRLPFVLMRSLCWLINRLLSVLGWVLRPLLGNINWQAPCWISKTATLLRKSNAILEQSITLHPLISSLSLLLITLSIGASFYGYHWHLNQPKPIEAAPLAIQQYDVTKIEGTFTDYKATTKKPETITINFSGSVAPIANEGKIVQQGVTLSPEIPGTWKWNSSEILVFTADKPLTMGTTYKIKLDADKLLAAQVKLKEQELTIKAPAFDYKITEADFYQNPQHPDQKSTIFHIKFNAPVEVNSVEKALSLSLQEGKQSTKPLKFSVVYDEKKLEAWIHSESLALPPDSGTVELKVADAIKSTVAANTIENAQSKSISVPGIHSLAVTNIETRLIESEASNGDKVILIDTSDAVGNRVMAKAVRAWLLPQHDPNESDGNSSNNDFYRWNLSDIDQKVLARATPLKIAPNDSDQENQNLFSFKYDAPSYRSLLIEINNNITSVGGYKLKNKHYAVIQVPDYPKTVRFISEGSLLSMSGEKQVSVATRNVPGLRLDIKRVIPSQLQHIASFKSGLFSSTSFNYVGPDYFTEHFQENIVTPEVAPGKINHQGIDLSRYLSDNPNTKRGIFLLTLTAWDPNSTNKDDEYEGNDDSETSENDQLSDSRFIVITDLGIIHKRANNSDINDIFVQSIHSGEPLSDAKVSVVAINGSSLMSALTDAQGHVQFPSLEAFKNERKPTMLLVEKEGDVSFLPLASSYDRQLDFSRFDTEGEINPRDPRVLSSYLFSDRGVYRPGDTFNIGLISRTADWSTALNGVPLKAEIHDPRDTLVSTVPLTLDSSGFNELSYTTGENSPTGEWTVYLYLTDKDNEPSTLLGHTSVNVKEFEPDRMKVKLNLIPNREKGWVKPDELKAAIEVQNLFGTPAQDRRITTKLILRPIYPSFDTLPDYQFYENRHNNDGFESTLEERKTDENGLTPIPLDLHAYADATYQLQLLSEAFEAGSGRSVAATARTLVSPYDYLVGIKADGDLGYISRNAERHLNVIAVNSDLKLIAQTELSTTLLQQKYVSVLTKQPSGVYKYQSKLKEEVVAETPLAINATGSDITLTTDNPGDYVLQIKNSQGQVLNRVSYTVAGNANLTRSLDRNAELKLKLNQAEYQAGDEIEVAINAPYTGSGLITIERDKVYSWQWFHTDTTSSIQKIRMPEGIEGNGYINVQFVRDANSDEIFMSPLSYGVVPFKISNNARKAGLQVESPELTKPGDTLKIKVKTDYPQKVIVFAVDEGILQVARYRLKDPLDYFFRKRQLDVESYQILDLILPEFSKIMSLAAAPGGDAGEGLDLHLNPFKRKKDKPVAYWSGITQVDGEQEFEYPIPDYFNGKIRVMAISVTPEKIGHAQQTSTVRDDFVLTPNVPAMVSPGDEFDVTLGVANNLQNMNGASAEINVTLSPPPQLALVGEATRKISLAEKREGMMTFRLKAQAVLGDAPLTFRATYDNKSAQRVVSTSVRPAMPYRVQTEMARMNSSTQKVSNLRTLYDAYAERQSSVSYSPLILSNGLAKYLADYPYYCSEQLVSRSIPLLLQTQHPEMRGKLNEAEVQTQLRGIMTTLQSRQNSQGEFGMWRSTLQSDPFLTPYIVLYLLEAQEANSPIPEGMLKEANNALRRFASDTSMSNDGDQGLYQLRLQAFATYLLTRQGEVTTNLLALVQSQLQKHYPDQWNEDLSALYLASSYQLLKMDKEANKLLAPSWKLLSKAYDKAWWSQNYYDPLVVDATRLYLISRHFQEKVKDIPPQALENMVKALKDGRYTTHSSAMSILALSNYTRQIESMQSDSTALNISATLQKGETKIISSAENGFAQAIFAANTQSLQFTNSSDLPAWYVVTQSGYDVNPPEKTISKGLEIVREYKDEQGNDISTVTIGQKINVHLKIRANSKEGQDNLAIVDLLPGGFEVIQQTPPTNTTGNNGSDQGETESESNETPVSNWTSPIAVSGSTWAPEYSDVREDRVVIYGYATDQVQEFVYQIKATNSGTFTIPPAYGEAMYNRDIQALSPSKGVITVKPATEK